MIDLYPDWLAPEGTGSGSDPSRYIAPNAFEIVMTRAYEFQSAPNQLEFEGVFVEEESNP